MKYKIEIHGAGYRDTAKTVDRPSLNRVTKTDVLEAKVEWCDQNKIDLDSDFELPFTRVVRATES